MRTIARALEKDYNFVGRTDVSCFDRFLIDHGARVDIVNNDGELPIDIADTDEMENLLQTEIYKQGIWLLTTPLQFSCEAPNKIFFQVLI